MSRGEGIAAVAGRPAGYALTALLGGAVVWLILSLGTRTFPWTRITPKPDPVHAPSSAYDWRGHPEAAFPLPPYARFLRDVTIVLDPGHGGRGDRKGWKRGPTGLREAEVNLRVALFLRDFLQAAGARAVLTRESDVYLDADEGVDLEQRAEIANRLGADLLLSIHHNAADGASEANYTAVFYHGTPDHSPASRDAARQVLIGLNDALRLEQHLGCALLSDYAIYPGKGFAVLRHAAVPAVLTEASFHSNPQEEERLRDPVYNRREAYGLFLGLARWAQAGLPRVWLIEPADGHVESGGTIMVRLEDGLRERGGFGGKLTRTVPGSLVVELEGRPVPHSVDFETGELHIRPARHMLGKSGWLYVDFANVFGQHVLHPWIELEWGGG